MKYAYVEIRGFQFLAQEGQTLEVPKLDAQEGEEILLKSVLYVRDGDRTKVGNPYVPEAYVKARVLETFKQPKVLVFKYKRRKNYRRKKGHRQEATRIQVLEIHSGKA